LDRGHQVTAIARDPSRIEPHCQIRIRKANMLDRAMSDILKGHDVVISATNFVSVPPDALIQTVKRSGVARLMVVGGAGSLYVSPGIHRYDQDDFPPSVRPQSKAGGVLLEALRRTSGINWTFLSPADEIVDGKRTGSFRLGLDDMLFDEAGRSWITYEDYAVAFLDELEKPANRNRRFTLSY
jgi:putative NADH-flavin reductase